MEIIKYLYIQIDMVLKLNSDKGGLSLDTELIIRSKDIKEYFEKGGTEIVIQDLTVLIGSYIISKNNDTDKYVLSIVKDGYGKDMRSFVGYHIANGFFNFTKDKILSRNKEIVDKVLDIIKENNGCLYELVVILLINHCVGTKKGNSFIDL